jgi:hypothetical protein
MAAAILFGTFGFGVNCWAGLSANQDGSVLLFNYGFTIVRWRLGAGADLVGLVRQFPTPEPLPGVIPVPQGSNYFMLQYPQVDADGLGYRFSGSQYCVARCSVFFFQNGRQRKSTRTAARDSRVTGG